MARRFTLALCVSAAFAVTAIAGPSNASSVLYSQALDNSGPGGLYSSDPTQIAADPFVIAGGGAIDQASWYGVALAGIPYSDFQVRFYADAGGAPGAVLSTFVGTATHTPTALTDGYGLIVDQFTLALPTFTAAAGVTYHFSVADTGPYNFIWAHSNFCCSTHLSGGSGWFPSLGSTNGSRAFGLSGPEAASAGGVPEPASWALMLGGLGLVGSSLRRRRGAVAVKS